MIVINKTTFEQMTGNPNNYPESSYVKYDGTIPSCATKYMKWSADKTKILQMTLLEKASVDSRLLSAAKLAKISQIKADSGNYEIAEFSKKQQRRASMGVFTDIKKDKVKKRMADADAEEMAKIELVNKATTIEAIELIKFGL